MYSFCFVVTPFTINSTLMYPWQGRVAPPTTAILLLQGINSCGIMPNCSKCWVPPRHMLAPLSGNTFFTKVCRFEDLKWPGFTVTSISSRSASAEFTVNVSVAGSCLRAKTWSTSSSSVLVEMMDSHPSVAFFRGPSCRHTEAKWLGVPQLRQSFPHALHCVGRLWSSPPHPLHTRFGGCCFGECFWFCGYWCLFFLWVNL